ncbi:MAG: hypothetical protein V3U29_08905 [Phycisphaeraceae bacterium]
MALYNFHRVLISSSILFFFGFSLYTFRQPGVTGRAADLAMAIGSGAVSLAMVACLIYFNYKIRVLQHRDDL